MPSPSPHPQDLVEERVTQLNAITQRRNALLKEMYHMIRVRNSYGDVLEYDPADDADDENVQGFLDRFDINKASIMDVPDLTALVSPRTSPSRAPSSEAQERPATVGVVDYDSPMSEPPTSPAFPKRGYMEKEEEEAQEPRQKMEEEEQEEREEESDDALATPRPGSVSPHRGRSASDLPHDKLKREDEEDEREPDGLDVIDRFTREESTIKAASEARSVSSMHRSSPAKTPRPASPSPQPGVEEAQVVKVVTATQQEEEEDAEDEDAVMEDVVPRPEREQEQEVEAQLAPAPEPTQPEARPEQLHKQEQEEEQELEDMEESPPPEPAPPLAEVSTSTELMQVAESSNAAPVASLFEVPSQSSSRLIPAPLTSITPSYTFLDFTAEEQPETLAPPVYKSEHADPVYPLPSLKILPAEFSRKTRSAKQRKKDKDKDKDAKGGGKDEWAPMGVAKWGATIRANPVWKKVSRTPKCLSTRDWSVAITELKITRALERVESLQGSGKWSFRQPKKQRTVGMLPKNHWDYMLDEMKWMRTDFREERRWKYVLAFNLSTAVLEWHAAGSREERMRSGICVLWKRPRARVESGQSMDVDNQAPDNYFTPAAGADDDEDNDDEDENGEARVNDQLGAAEALQDALDTAGPSTSENSQVQTPAPERLQPKIEELEDSSALQSGASGEDSNAMAVDNSQEGQTEGAKAKKEDKAPNELAGLKTTSNDPVLVIADSAPANGEVGPSFPKKALKTQVYAPLREHIAYTDEQKLFLELDDLDLNQRFSELSTADSGINNIGNDNFDLGSTVPDLSDIFPELQPMVLPDVVNTTIPSVLSETKKKSDRKVDRDDNRRVDESAYNKLVPVGRFMHAKPTLLSALQPAKRFKDGVWLPVEDPVVCMDYAGPPGKTSDDSLLELFDGNKASSSAIVAPAHMQYTRDAKKRAEHNWSAGEDALLRSIVAKYPSNWTLVADTFNASRVTISIDRRTPWDCFERWCNRFGGGLRPPPPPLQDAAADGAPGPSSHGGGQMTTRGVKRLASVSMAAGAGSSSAGQTSDAKKRRRHALMYETMRKVSKKREAAQKTAAQNARKAPAVHDTHGKYNNMPRLTPAELSRMKADKDARDNAEMMLRRRQQDLAQQQLRAQQQQQGAQAAGQPAQAGQQQAVNGVARQAAPATPNVPQMRAAVPQVNISQQQRIPTPMTAQGAQRMSPQQMLQAQAHAMARHQAQVQAQQAQAQAQAAVAASIANGNNGGGNGQAGAHLSPPYQSRAASASPNANPAQASPPQIAAALSAGSNSNNNAANAMSPRPPSAQAQLATMQVPGNALPRPASSIPAHYFPVVNGPQMTQEGLEQAMRFQSLLA
ncbi:hypothetical protein CONPUDRAFT_98516, partial [Coniophora puteana RWD-64-598 SS2]